MKKIFCLLMFFMGAHSPLAVASDADLETLIRLNSSGDSAKAYEHAAAMLPTWEGDPLFDRQFALAALGNGRVSEGIFALERLLILDPQDSAARLEMARAYAMLGMEPLSASTDPLTSFHANTPVSASLSGSLKVGVGYSDNVDARPEADSMMTPSGPVVVAGLQPRDDSFGSFELDGRYRFPLSASWSGFVEGRLASRFYQDVDDRDSLSTLLRTGALLRSDRSRLQLSLVGQQYRRDDSRLLDRFGLSADYLHGISDALSVGFFTSVDRNDYAISDIESDILMAGLRANYRAAHQLDPLFYAGLYRGWEEPQEHNPVTAGRTERDLYGAYTGVRLELSDSAWVNMQGAFVSSRYEGPFQLVVPATSNARRDSFMELELDLGWRLDERWTGLLGYAFQDNSSNTDLLEYRRQQVELMLQYDF